MSTQGFVETQLDRWGIATITFFHPSQNAMPGALLRQLAETITTTALQPETRVIVLQSSGERTFCAGASFDELIAIEDEVVGLAFFSGFAQVINACRKSNKIIIGRVQGKAVGGGVGIASAVDICLATQQASIKLSELVVGIGPFVVGPAVERKVGLSAFIQLSLQADTFFDSSWALSQGLYSNVLPNIASLDEAVHTLALKLAAYNPEALTEMKKVYWAGTEHWDQLLIERAKISGRLVLSDFTKQAIAQFKDKR